MKTYEKALPAHTGFSKIKVTSHSQVPKCQTHFKGLPHVPKHQTHHIGLSHGPKHQTHSIGLPHVPKHRTHHIGLTHVPKHQTHSIGLPHVPKHRTHHIGLSHVPKLQTHYQPSVQRQRPGSLWLRILPWCLWSSAPQYIIAVPAARVNWNRKR